MIKDFFKCDPVGRMKGDERREHILQAAVKLFSQRGFSGTTTKEIARASGVSEAMVFRHFASKDTLYAAILDGKAGQDGVHEYPWESNLELQAAIASKDDFSVFYHFGLQAMNKHQSDPNFIRLLLFSALEEHKISQQFFDEFVDRIYGFLGEYIHSRQEEGAMREVNPRIVTRAFLGNLIHHSLNNILWDKNRRLLNITNEEAAKNFAEIILHGVLK